MKTLKLSKDLKLPAEETAEAAIGLIAKRGRGKTGVLKVLMEEMAAAGVPFVMFDPVGIAYGLRSSFDGKEPSGIKVLVVGGAHADVRLERRAGAEVARAIVQANVSAIIDFSDEPKSVYREFLRDFSNEIFRINDSARLVIIEEAPEVVPQRLRPDMTTTFDAVERLVSRGRNKGLGVVLVSQRAATINKDVLTQVDVMIVMGLTAPQDRAALKEWVEAKADAAHLKEFNEGLAGLQRQEGWVWSPEMFGGIFRRVRFRDFRTFHPDKTHLRRLGLLQVKPVATDVSSIVAKLGVAVARISNEKTAAASASRLEAQVKRLESELAKATERAAAPVIPKTAVKTVEVVVVKDAQLRRVEQLVAAAGKQVDRALEAAEKLKGLSHTLSIEGGRLAASVAEARQPRPPTSHARPPPASRGAVAPSAPAPSKARGSMAIDEDEHDHDSAPAVKAGARRMLQAPKWMPKVERELVAAAAKRDLQDEHLNDHEEHLSKIDEVLLRLERRDEHHDKVEQAIVKVVDRLVPPENLAPPPPDERRDVA